MIKHIVLAAVAACAVASSANAATVIFQPGVFGAPNGYTLYSDFNTVDAQAVVSGNNFVFPTGSVSGQYTALPANNTPYLAVLGGGVANIAFNNDVRSFSFDYSTVDTYNTLTINYADGGFESVVGGDILTAGQIDGQVSGSFIINGDGRLISGLSLATTQNAFEVDNLAVSGALAAVPEPTTWVMMIAGFGLVGVGMRRRTAAAVVA
ncbi:PEPxxWA-CTERM sorting domain-containing protein [Polymorphobacter fuscus]|uniref:PEPxxWA-CTERM sorting domain-containing protein n=1 Tax=Sandarakinorhabdus fusca TaxID=1439888 RepID=A0A7C9KHY5_9SPHN|nr:PEPxxWA-CTERM sorting domain-containing protein [Polymorphobacter fuscus]KAB7647554.1 PEP-CTERM sorting domain-containing protein [Polymorphobacter fuscus]MQT16819.1 PEPxxWA-CTERM sorting domain-containing protein [Polymorphobacter fuscus]NJC09192.1 opacity protein-like surface antigen [Polymorphobacter fuscus]